MENVGAVTYSEMFVFKEKVVPKNEMEDFVNCILHELYHIILYYYILSYNII